MAYVDFLSSVHKATNRDYVARVTEYPKAEAAKLAKQWGKDYWDGDRRTGYGGFSYDGRWRKVADAMVAHYGIKPGDRILDVGCGKGFLLYDFTQSVKGAHGDGSADFRYVLEHANHEVKPFLRKAVGAPGPIAVRDGSPLRAGSTKPAVGLSPPTSRPSDCAIEGSMLPGGFW